MEQSPKRPEVYFLPPTPRMPNSHLPLLIYRGIVPPSEFSVEQIKERLENNHWGIGGVFPAYCERHFHMSSHECYAVVSGASSYRLGQGKGDPDSFGTDVRIEVGDVMVLPVSMIFFLSSDQFSSTFVWIVTL